MDEVDETSEELIEDVMLIEMPLPQVGQLR